MIRCVVPARVGSERAPAKNCVLVPSCVKVARKAGLVPTIFTDDPLLASWAQENHVRQVDRSPAGPKQSMKDALAECVRTAGWAENDIVVVLYPTFVLRTAHDLRDFIAEIGITRGKIDSWLGLRPLRTAAHLVYDCSGGAPVPALVDENEHYREQDASRHSYRELTHFLCAAKVGALLEKGRLNAQLRSERCATHFVDANPERSLVDVDHPRDLVLAWAMRAS